MSQTPAFVLFTLLCFGASGSEAKSSNVTDVLKKVETAYGGPQLRRMRRVRILSDRRLAWPGQGQTSAFVEYATDRQHKYLDLRRRFGSVERWIHQTGNIYHNRYIVNAEGAATVDYASMTYSLNEKGTYWASFVGDYRSSDLLLAYHLVTEAKAVKHTGTQSYQGHIHDVLTVEIAPETPRLEVFVSRRDGLIRRVRMQREFGMVNIVFASFTTSPPLGEHKRTKARRGRGVRYAKEYRAYLDDTLVEYEHALSVAVNVPIARHLKLEKQLRPAPASVDTSKMTVEALAPGVFHVGKDDYSLFASTEDGYIAVSTYPGLKARYEALVAHTKDKRPLSQAIVTHHHGNHMDGIRDAIALGARLHVTRETKRMLDGSEAKDVPVTVLHDGDTVGPFKIYVRPTAHAVENAFVYHPQSKLLFQDDHYHGLLQNEPTWAQPTAVTLHAIIERLGIPVDRLLSGHARKGERWADFETAVKRTRPRNLCPSRRRICRDKLIN